MNENKALIAAIGDNETTKAVVEALAAAANIIREVGEMLTHFASSFVKVLKNFMNVALGIILWAAGQVNPKYWHYYKHAKRRRIRKKYRDKLFREIFAAIAKGR